MKKGINYPGITVVFLCHDGTGHYLLHQRSKKCRDEHGRWDCGGGSLQFGELIEEALVREIKEEYVTHLVSKQFLGYRDVHREHDGRPTHWIALDFKIQVEPENISIGEPEKIDQLGWFSLENFPEPLHSQLPIFIEKYKDVLK